MVRLPDVVAGKEIHLVVLVQSGGPHLICSLVVVFYRTGTVDIDYVGLYLLGGLVGLFSGVDISAGHFSYDFLA